MYDRCVAYLNKRGVTLDDIADCVMFLQHGYHPELTQEQCKSVVEEVLHKREVQHAVLTGIGIDEAVEKHHFLDSQLEMIIQEDSPLYGIDEVLAYGICNLYGSIALTNYGYIDKCKPGIIEKLNLDHAVTCNTFLDDIVGAVAASAAGKIAHNFEQR